MTDKEITENQEEELHDEVTEDEVVEAHDPKNAESQSVDSVDKAGDATGTAPKRKGDNTKKEPMPKTKAGKAIKEKHTQFKLIRDKLQRIVDEYDED